MDFLVGTFTHNRIYTLRFTPKSGQEQQKQPVGKLEIRHISPTVGKHSWLALSPSKSHLYTTVWSEPPTIAAYKLSPAPDTGAASAHLINTKPVRARSGLVAASATHVYSAGGDSGEVYAVQPEDGGLGALTQELSFVDLESAKQKQAAEQEDVPHGNFGGVRHGAHSAELAPDGSAFYVADIGRNCIWTFSLDLAAASSDRSAPHLKLGEKHISPRSNDGPRHTTPHPNGKVLYSLQEHSSMVDVFDISHQPSSNSGETGPKLKHVSGVRILPAGKHEDDFWADEVRVGPSGEQGYPRYLYASNRGLASSTKGYVAVFALDADGHIKDETPLDMYETATSGGWANAVEPAPRRAEDGVEYVAMTDSEEGWVFVLGFDGRSVWEAARLRLGSEDGEEGKGVVVGAATAVWL